MTFPLPGHSQATRPCGTCQTAGANSPCLHSHSEPAEIVTKGAPSRLCKSHRGPHCFVLFCFRTEQNRPSSEALSSDRQRLGTACPWKRLVWHKTRRRCPGPGWGSRPLPSSSREAAREVSPADTALPADQWRGGRGGGREVSHGAGRRPGWGLEPAQRGPERRKQAWSGGPAQAARR